MLFIFLLKMKISHSKLPKSKPDFQCSKFLFEVRFKNTSLGDAAFLANLDLGSRIYEQIFWFSGIRKNKNE